MAEPVRYAADAQFADLKTADLVVAAKVERLRTSARKGSEKSRDLHGPVAEVSATLQVLRLIRGQTKASELDWNYVLQFGVEPTLEAGDVALFFFKVLEESGNSAKVRAVYLPEDSLVILPGAVAAALRDGQVRFSVTHIGEGDQGRYTYWVPDQPEPQADLVEIQKRLDLRGTGNYVTAYANGDGWRVLESVALEQRWPY